MKKIIAVIERATDGGFGVYAADENLPLYGYGLTEEEARADFEEFVQEQAAHYKERTGSAPDWWDEQLTFEYQYDISGFFEAFPFINTTKFAEAIGINPSLMRKYKCGAAHVGAKQKKLIQTKFDDIAHRFSAVRFGAN